MYARLRGRRPFEGETFVQVALQHLNTPPPSLVALNPAVPPSVAWLVERALAKDPAERFADGADLAAVLRGEAEALGLADLGHAPALGAIGARWPGVQQHHVDHARDAAPATSGSAAWPSPVPVRAAGEQVPAALEVAHARHAVVTGPPLMARVQESVRLLVARRARPSAGASRSVGVAADRVGPGAAHGFMARRTA